VYDGSPDGKKFGPAAKSMLYAPDFETPEDMAKFIQYLDSNDTAYQEYLEWKRIGPSDDWVRIICPLPNEITNQL
jgi:galactoside 3-L-fucosyltransferase 11